MKLKSLLSIVLFGMIGTTAFATTSKLEQEPQTLFTETYEVNVDFVNVETFDFTLVEQSRIFVGNYCTCNSIKKLDDSFNSVIPSYDVGWSKSKVNFNEVNKLPKRIAIDPNIKSGVIRIRSDS